MLSITELLKRINIRKDNKKVILFYKEILIIILGIFKFYKTEFYKKKKSKSKKSNNFLLLSFKIVKLG